MKINGRATQENIYQYNKLSRLIEQFQHKVESKSGSLQKKFPSSPKLRNAAKKIQCYKILRAAISTNKQIPERIQEFATSLDIQTEHLTKIQIQQGLKREWINLHEIQRNATDLRKIHLEEWADFYASILERPKQAIIQSIQNAEAIRTTFRKIKYALNPQENSKITKVINITDDGQTELITEANEIYETILENNKAIMTSGKNSLPASSAFREVIGDNGEKYGVEQLLNGTLNIENIVRNKYEQEFLRALSISNNNDSHHTRVSSEVTFEEYKAMFHATRESMSSSPSGLHIGHYKVGALFPEIGEILAIMMSLPVMYSFSPERWKKSVHIMLEKIQGRPLINKLRIIQLFEADFNAVMKIKISRQLMRDKEVDILLGNDMHGGRQKRTAQQALLTQQLTFNISRQKRLQYSVINLDATKCFDRIYPNLAVITMTKIGSPKGMIVSLAKTLNGMQHRIRTAHGLSTNTISAPHSELWSGVGQGGGASIPIWLSMELPMLESLKKFSKGIELSDPTMQHTFRAMAIGFIDDNNIIITYPQKVTHQEQQVQLNDTYRAWNGLLMATGGELSHDKCSTSCWDWKWKNGTPIPLEIPVCATINNEEQKEKKLKQIHTATATKYLSILCDPLCTYNEEYTTRLNKAQRFSAHITKSTMKPHQVRVAYYAIWEAKIRYIASVVTFNATQWEKIQGKILNGILPKLHINRRMPRRVIFGRGKYLGMEYMPHYAMHGHEMIKFILTSIRQNQAKSSPFSPTFLWGLHLVRPLEDTIALCLSFVI